METYEDTLEDIEKILGIVPGFMKALPKEVLHKVKLIAVKRRMSVSGLLTDVLEKMVAEADEYAKARQQHLAILEKGYNMGTNGVITWSRDEIHER